MSANYDQTNVNDDERRRAQDPDMPVTGTRQDDTIQDQSYQPGPPESGAQSYNASGQSNTGGYSQPESGSDRSQGGVTQPQSGYNQGEYNQPGSYSQEQDENIKLRDGYKDTEGTGYNRQGGDTAQAAQEGYDPTQSGVRQAQNEPGKRVDVPGRETGSSWGEDQQMGYDTDTPDRKNPAG